MLQLNNFSAEQSRIEESGATGLELEKYDLIMSRAFTSLETFLRLALTRINPGGRVLAMKGPEGREELAGVSKVLQANICEPQVVDYVLPFSSAVRQIIIVQKPEDCLSNNNNG